MNLFHLLTVQTRDHSHVVGAPRLSGRTERRSNMKISVRTDQRTIVGLCRRYCRSFTDYSRHGRRHLHSYTIRILCCQRVQWEQFWHDRKHKVVQIDIFEYKLKHFSDVRLLVTFMNSCCDRKQKICLLCFFFQNVDIRHSLPHYWTKTFKESKTRNTGFWLLSQYYFVPPLRLHIYQKRTGTQVI